MNNIIVIGAVIFILISGIPIVGLGNSVNSERIYHDVDNVYFKIKETENTVLIFDDMIGGKEVKYWVHMIDNITIKGDSILLHLDPTTGRILDFQETWSDISSEDISKMIVSRYDFEPSDCLWKKLVLFPDKESCLFSYSFYEEYNYPLICWEVRYEDGNTILYDLNGSKIGYDIPIPSENGFALSGDCNEKRGDCWSEWRGNAASWFTKWCDSVESERFPTATELREVIQNPDLHFFYELAHGDYKRFQCGRETENYNTYFSSWLEEDMENRDRMKFAFIGSCGGMTNTGDGSFSFEFRKGTMEGTVTIGYTHMPDYPGSFGDTLPWQKTMFSYMNKGWTIKKSFDEACSYTPVLSDYVVFVGDENLKVKDNPPLIPDKPEGYIHLEVNESAEYSSKSYEPDGDMMYYMFDWGDGNTSEWIGPFESNTVITSSYQWMIPGVYSVKIRAKDVFDIESEWSDALNVFIKTKPPSDPIVNGTTNGKTGETYAYTFSSVDPEDEMITYMVLWGDGGNSCWMGPYYSGEIITVEHSYEEDGTYLIQVMAKDETGATSNWSTLEVSMPKSRFIPLEKLRIFSNIYNILNLGNNNLLKRHILDLIIA